LVLQPLNVVFKASICFGAIEIRIFIGCFEGGIPPVFGPGERAERQRRQIPRGGLGPFLSPAQV
jgi:hypothetical protein